MNTYKVIKEKGVRTTDGSLIKKGKTFKASPRSAMVQLQLRCKEIEEVKAEAPKEPAPPKVKEIKEVKAELKKLKVEFTAKTSEEDLRKLLAEATKDS